MTALVKERMYPKLPEVAHCPNCHRRVLLPKFLKTAQIGGPIRLNCGACKSGVAVIQPVKSPEVEVPHRS